MSIVRLKRLTLIGLAREKTEVLEQLQALGRLHLLPPHPRGEGAGAGAA